MRNLKKCVALLLVFVLCSCACAFSSQPTGAIDEMRIKSGYGLEMIKYGELNILKGLSEKKTLSELLSMFYVSGSAQASAKGKVLSNNDYVPTGAVVSCGDYRFYVVVKGDTTGDGVVNASDFMQIKNFFLGDYILEDTYYMASDTNESGSISTSDYLQVRKYFLKEFELYPEITTPIVSTIDIIIDGYSEYKICYSNDSDKSAAFTLQELLKEKTGATLPVELSSSTNKAIVLENVSTDLVGNYGYYITANESFVTISASELAGFDKAFSRLTDEYLFAKTLSVPSDYYASDKLNWQTDYVLSGADYKAEYLSDTFYNDKNDSVAYVTNTMWHMFGLVDDGQKLVGVVGNEPTWFEWNSEKIIWSGSTTNINTVKTKIRNFPQTSTGYMWSWSSYPYWKIDDCYSIHYDGTFRYISAVYDIISWEANTNFLYLKDTNGTSGDYSSMDSSRGKTVLQKTEACMNYILEYLHGNEGYIRLTEESTYLNDSGSKRFDHVIDAGINCWNNTGKMGSAASNYWDNLCFGNYDAYSNALFYNALHSMAKIYRMIGGTTYIRKAESLEALAVTVKEKFNELYWDEEKGRYIACIDSDGNPVDYGLTFHNFEILKYGLADEEKAKSIFDWVDGDRIVKGDTRVGKDIFSYAKIMEPVIGANISEITSLGLSIAAVTNTVAINNVSNKPLAWWHAPAGIDVWTSASYGKHLENGGYIFYPVFYELMARTQYEGAQATTDRLFDIGKVYEYNRLKSDAAAAGSTYWLEGLVGEYPESGLVPTAYLYSLIGLSAEYNGLYLAPAFNDVYEYMGVKKFDFAGKTYGIKVNRDASCEITAVDGSISMNLHYTPERFNSKTYTMTIEKTSGAVNSYVLTPDANGVVHADISGSNIKCVKITPNL